MDIRKYEYRSDFARKYVAQGRVEGEAEGRVVGKAEGKAEALLQVLSARGIAISDPHRAEVLACGDHATLDRWLARVVTAQTIEAVLAK